MKSKKIDKSRIEEEYKKMLRTSSETIFMQGNVDWVKIYSSVRKDSDWLKEIKTKHRTTMAYWDSRAPTFTHGTEYYDRISKELINIINTPFTLLEIGAGSGNFTLPLSSHAQKILVVEPAPKMVGLLKERLVNLKVENVKVQQSTWENTTVSEKYDVSLFSHSNIFHEGYLVCNKESKNTF